MVVAALAAYKHDTLGASAHSAPEIMRGWPSSTLCLFVPVAVAIATFGAYGSGSR